MQKIPLQLGTILLTVVIGVGGATSDALSQGIALSNKVYYGTKKVSEEQELV
jgi:hypothetical protein